MSDSKHTPGPWEIDTDMFETGIAIIQPGGPVVAEAWPMVEYEPIEDEVAMANARLIAASPEMFDVLLLIGDTLASEHPHDWTDGTIKLLEQKIRAVTELKSANCN